MHAKLIEAAFRSACRDEIRALKPGNVHTYADGHGMTAGEFMRSADVAAPALCTRGASLGVRVLRAVRRTRAVVGQNTNLGILLLCAPLAMAAEAGSELRDGVRAAIAQADVGDTGMVFESIVLAAPGGLGTSARHDVRAPATVPLAVAMAEAAPRDRIASEYTTGFAEVFGSGLEAYVLARERWADPPWAAVAVYLRFLTVGPDSHVLRKWGKPTAGALREEAETVERAFQAHRHPTEAMSLLLQWDSDLKRRGINPGTCADLTVATIFAYRLRHGLPAPIDDD